MVVSSTISLHWICPQVDMQLIIFEDDFQHINILTLTTMIYLTIFHPFIILASSWGYSDMSCMEVDSVIAIPKDLVMMELGYMRKHL